MPGLENWTLSILQDRQTVDRQCHGRRGRKAMYLGLGFFKVRPPDSRLSLRNLYLQRSSMMGSNPVAHLPSTFTQGRGAKDWFRESSNERKGT